MRIIWLTQTWPTPYAGRRQRASCRRTKGRAALTILQRLGLTRHPIVFLLGRIWQLRENLSAHDAAYGSLAEAFGCPLLTANARLAGATGPRCVVTLVPR